MKLVIVESPTKAKTLSRFLGRGYEVVASMGHVRDLPKKELGVDVDNDFFPKYVQSPRAKKVIDILKKKAEEADEIYLATDPDREGEAISWHVLSVITAKKGKKKKNEGVDASDLDSSTDALSASTSASDSKKAKTKKTRKGKKDEPEEEIIESVDLSALKGKTVKRVVFHEITEPAVKDAFNHSRELDMNLVDAQQARRVLDRMVGYKLSPLLWKKVRYGLSAGRVQSVAVRLVVDREDERKNFKPEEYWSLDGVFSENQNAVEAEKAGFLASLFEVASKKADIKSKDQMDSVLAGLKPFQQFTVRSVEKSEKKRNPYPPFTTSTMQQAASNRLGFSAKRTMSAAQKLFEDGLITYHRTDSLNLSEDFLNSARSFISKTYGANFLPEKPNFYKNKSRNAQEAHEAVRPTNPAVPFVNSIEMSADEKRLYRLIWQRALSSQMLPQIYDNTACLIDSPDGGFTFKATGSVIKFDGWMKVYEKKEKEEKEIEVTEADGVEVVDQGVDAEGTNDADLFNPDALIELPDLKEGQKVNLLDLKPEQHFTQPPARYTEASLIKALEEDGIGRPSTYAPTISTIQDRGYIAKDGKSFYPNDVAVVVNKLLNAHFPNIVDYGFTANMEESLDRIANGEEEWVPVLRKFYEPFIAEVERKDEKLNKADFTLLEVTEEKCPECGKVLNVKLGKYGRFLSCSGFPECKYARPLAGVGGGGSAVVSGGANGDPNAFVIDETQLGKCPDCKDGDLNLREGRYGKFVACGNYPKCKFTKPYLEKVGMKCPKCGEGEAVIKRGGRFKRIFYGCSRYPDCDFVTNKDPMKFKWDPEEAKAKGKVGR